MAVRIRGRSTEHATTVHQWEQLLTTMLQAAIRYGKLKAKVEQQQAWLNANPDHPLWLERRKKERQTWRTWNAAVNQTQDTAEALSRLQAGLPADSRSGLAALLGHELWPYAPNRWAMVAAKIQSDDIFAIAARVMMEERAEDERDATGAEHGDTEHA